MIDPQTFFYFWFLHVMQAMQDTTKKKTKIAKQCHRTQPTENFKKNAWGKAALQQQETQRNGIKNPQVT